MSVGLLI